MMSLQKKKITSSKFPKVSKWHLLSLSILLFISYNFNYTDNTQDGQLLQTKAKSYSNIFIDNEIEAPYLLTEAFEKQAINNEIFHLFSHGRSGELLINNQWYDAVTIADWLQKTDLLKDKTHLNIYGCEFAKGEKGKLAVDLLEKKLGITIAASDDVTGQNGDWDLEIGQTKDVLDVKGYSYNLQGCCNNTHSDGGGHNHVKSLTLKYTGPSGNVNLYTDDASGGTGVTNITQNLQTGQVVIFAAAGTKKYGSNSTWTYPGGTVDLHTSCSQAAVVLGATFGPFQILGIVTGATGCSEGQQTVSSIIANDDNATVTQCGQSVTINILNNDTNTGGGTLTVTLQGSGAHGTFVKNSNNTVTYTVTSNTFSGTDQINYQVCNSSGQCDIGKITINGGSTAKIEGTVFTDANQNGTLNGGEIGLNGVMVNIYRDNDNNGQVNSGDFILSSITTANGGKYSYPISSGITTASNVTLSQTTNASTNDSYQESSGTNKPSNYEGGEIRWKGYRFTNLNIPSNATITSATLQLVGYKYGSTIVNVKAEKIKAPGAYTSANNYLSTRTTTSASKPWSIPALSDGLQLTSPNFNNVVQEVVNTQNGVTHLSLIISSSAKWETWNFDDGVTTKRPKLNITYQIPGNPVSFVVQVDLSTLPPNNSLTTDNVETASFSRYGALDCNNNFGVFGSCPTAVNNTSTATITESQTKTLVGSPTGGIWTIVSGGGTISGTTYTPPNITANTNVTVRYTIAANGSCPASTADKTFTVTVSNDPCDALGSGNLDTDGDGVADICDLDDDNDGILDVNEQDQCTNNLFVNDNPVVEASWHGTLIRTQNNWLVAGQKLNGLGGDQLTYQYMSNLYSYPSAASPVFVTLGGQSTLIALFSNGAFYTAGYDGINSTEITIGNALNLSIMPSFPSWGQINLTLPAGVQASDVKSMKASGKMLMILTNSGNLYVTGQEVNNELNSSYSTTAFNQIPMPSGVGVKFADIAHSSIFIYGTNNQFYRFGQSTFDGNGSALSAITTQADLMTQPNLSGSFKMMSVGSLGAYYVLDSNGNLYVLGFNSHGQLGIGNTTNQLTWTQLPGYTGIKYISAINNTNANLGKRFGVAAGFIGSNNKVYFMGGNERNLLTDAAASSQTTPVLASGTNQNAIYLVAGGHVSPYISSNFFIYNTGHNEGGAFGDGTITDRVNYSGTSIAGIIGQAPVVSCDIDTDGDGIPDRLDPDSDNDGCPDAIEGGGSFTNADINSNDQLTGGVDANGVPIVATANGQTVGSSQDASVQDADCLDPCDPIASGNTDTDGDGIANICDLDDDNDGILDVDEGCNFCSNNNIFLNGNFENGPFPSTFIQTNQNNVPGWSTTSTDNLIEIWKSGFNPGAAGGGQVFSQNGSYHAEINATQNAALYQEICTNPGAQISWSVWHRGRLGTDVAVVKIGQIISTATIQATMTTGNTAWVNYTGTYTVPQSQTTTLFIFQAISSSGGNNSVGNFVDNIVIQEITPGICLDTDNDGIPNSLDPDSDNDGCPDAIEGGGSFTNADINSNDQLTGGVDANGVPIVATANGQAVGSSQNAALQDANCTDLCDPLASGNLDTDGDGVADICDLDDDNDGILDSDECGCPTTPSTTNQLTAPSSIYTIPTNRFGIDVWSVASRAFDGSGLSAVPTTEASLATITHASPTNVFTNAAYLSDGSGINNDWVFTFATPTDIKGIAFWIPGSTAYGGGDAPFKKFQISGVDCSGTPFSQIFDLGTPSPNVKTVYFTSPLIGVTSLTLDILEVWYDQQMDLGAAPSGWEIATPTTVPFNFNVTLGEVRFINQIGPYPVLTCNIDTDGDGIPNNLDLDSDNDGCPDAIEGGGSFTSSDIDGNNRLTGGVDANGIPIVATANGQAVGSSQDSTLLDVACFDECDPIASGNIDTDEDGIADICDLDDDNDGILDTDEGCSQYYGGDVILDNLNIMAGNGATLAKSTMTDYVDLQSPAGQMEPSGQVYVTGYDSGTGQGSANITLNSPQTLTIQNKLVVKIQYYNAIANNNNISLYTLNPKIELNTNLGIFTLTHTLTTAEKNQLVTKNWIPIQFEVPITGTTVTVNSLKLYLEGLNGGEGATFVPTTSEVFGFGIDAIKSDLSCQDTDGDGIPDAIDADSDNDGCPDAIEGGGSFTTGDIDKYGQLISGVDANGIPLVAAPNGQTVGSSQNVNIVVCCDPIASGSPDTDNDGIADICDLDDDNDGILDGEECSTPINSTFSFNRTTIPGTANLTTAPTTGWSQPIISSPTSTTYAFTTSTPGESSSDPSGSRTRGTLSNIFIQLNRDANETLHDFQLNLSNNSGGFDDGMYLEINGVAIMSFDQADWQGVPAFTSKFGSWTPWNSSSNPPAFVFNVDKFGNATIQMLLNTIDGTPRQDALAFIPNSKPNPVPVVNIETGFTIGLAFRNIGGLGNRGTFNLNATADFSKNNFIGCDTDDDGIPNPHDPDSDGDGCLDVVESGGIDADNDGVLDGTGINSDGLVTGGTGGYDGANGSEYIAHRINILNTPIDTTILGGNAVTFTINASADVATYYSGGTPIYGGTPGNANAGLLYQWYMGNPNSGGMSLTDNAIFSGTNTATLTISDTEGLNGYEFCVVVTHQLHNCPEIHCATLTLTENCTNGVDDDGDGLIDCVDPDCTAAQPGPIIND